MERESDLAGCFAKYRVTIADLTPSVARTLGPAVLSKLSTLIMGGEIVLPTDTYLTGQQTRIVNGYGPAECTPTSTIAEMSAEENGIGRGAGICTWVVDITNP
jgi:non-ribosomal peptide synthetase component F